jgi:hypothetical protein
MRKTVAGLVVALSSLALVATPASAETVDPTVDPALVVLEDAYADAQAEVSRLTALVATLEAQVAAAEKVADAAAAEVEVLGAVVDAKKADLAAAEAELAAAIAERDTLQARFDAFECGNGGGAKPTQCRLDRDGVLVLLNDAKGDVVTADTAVTVAGAEVATAEANLGAAIETAAAAHADLQKVSAELAVAVIDLGLAETVRDDAKAALDAYVPPAPVADTHPGCKGIAVAQTKATKGNAPAALAAVSAKFGC